MNNARISTRTPARLALLAATALALSAQGGLAQAACKTCGTVTEVRAVTQKGEGGSGLGIAAGAVVGGLLGNQVGKGDGRKAATAAGAVAGGVIGNQIDKRHVGGRVVQRTERQCHTEQTASESSRVTGYNVTYRKADGSTGSMRMDKQPGSRIALGNASRTVGYDVTYRFNGQEKKVRMDDKPASDRLPVIDGQVVTQTAAVDAAAARR